MNNHKFSVLIIDDEPEARFLLKSLLSEINYVTDIDEADNAESALYKIIENNPNLILLDINMPGKSGMDLVELMQNRNIDVPVVLVSAYENYAIKAIQNQIFDFLIKPVMIEDLKNVIEKHKRLDKKYLSGKLMEVLSSIKEESKIRINSRYSYILIKPSEIVYCNSEDGYTALHLSSGKKKISNTSLTQIESEVNAHNFHRLGRSVLINLDYVRSINKGTDSVLLKYDETYEEVFSSHKSIKELLKSNFNYA